jgi:hypothetical protein
MPGGTRHHTLTCRDHQPHGHSSIGRTVARKDADWPASGRTVHIAIHRAYPQRFHTSTGGARVRIAPDPLASDVESHPLTTNQPIPLWSVPLLDVKSVVSKCRDNLD